MLGIFALIILMTHSMMNFEEAQFVAEGKKFLLQLNIYALLFGVLLEWRGLNRLIRIGFKINYLILPFLVIVTLVFIPTYQWTIWFGISSDGWLILIEPFRQVTIHMILAVLSGVLLIRSIAK